MKKLLVLSAIIIMAFAACNKQEFNKITDYTGVVVEGSTMEPIEGVKVSVTNGSRVHTSTITDAQGTFALTVDFDRITTDYFLLLDGSPQGLPISKEELRGMGKSTYDYKEVVLYNKNAPSVTTAEVTDIFTKSATMGGTVTDAHGFNITERGVCWSNTPYPTIDNDSKIMGSGLGDFSASVNDLQKETTYYVRAYAINSAGVGYGEEVSFTTMAASSGLFSVSDTKQVYIALTNLQYQASTNTWRFAINPWDYVGYANTYSGYSSNYSGNVIENGEACDNELASSSYTGWIDRFAWGTSGYDHGAVNYQPWSTGAGNQQTYAAYGNSSFNLYDMTGMADWGYNAISNGGNQENQWRTMTYEEFRYLFNRLYLDAPAFVNGVPGYILLPDDWDESIYQMNYQSTYFSSNTISSSDWTNVFEEAGAVFLPFPNQSGGYWTSSKGAWDPYSVYYNMRLEMNTLNAASKRLMVRLVHDAQ